MTMEIGLRRLEILREALALARVIKFYDDHAQTETFVMNWKLVNTGIGDDEIASLHEDISCRIATIKEMETI